MPAITGTVEFDQPLYVITTLLASAGSVSIQERKRPVVVELTGKGAFVRSVQLRPPSRVFQIRPVEVPT
jgi:hypothetical protein